MTTPARMTTLREASAAQLRAAIEDLYARSDEVLAGLDASGWRRAHGKQWTMADVPYHLAYFERELVIAGIERGESLPPEAQFLLSTPREIDAWNDSMLSLRPRGQSGPEALEELRAVRARMRELTASMGDADLALPFWTPLAGIGWRDRRYALASAIIHNWSEHMQLLIRLERGQPLPEPETTHLALDGMVRHLPMGITREVARPFRARLEFTGAGGGSWLLHAHDFACDVTEDATSAADLVLTMTPRTWVRLWNRMTNPLALVLSGRLRVSGYSRLATFGRIFGPPSPNTPLTAGFVVL